MSSSAGTDDRAELAGYVGIWWQAVNDFLDLLEELGEEEWTAPTDLAGWDVRACAGHTAHLESVLAGNPEETADIGEPAHVRGVMGMYTEIGVVNRREASPDAIINEIREVTTKRHTTLLADPPTDGDAKPAVIFGGVPWSWRTLLRNRPLDVWMHEQDVRRAVGRPGNMDSAAARHTADYLAESLGYVLGKKVGAPTGTSLVLDMEGSEPFAFEIDDNGRGQRVPVPADATVTLRMDRESFIRLAGGRCQAEPGRVSVAGDRALGEQVLASLATTP
ncbi:MAG TPA: maleylpyruvate isomerase family mycothiol-dependent enzyme [Nocardioides sp.]|uniref:maleylpyruvate isomerase family mycothiol-dependent enzyme n=1 Tax=Nocardioides sp. TaxID=35761 RepID=UPI002E317022|nr:maleylpyruvate isomerase family mycothiol-dependent enzyme [Nocardioides sp.]HEX5090729.1 maleylpyruvate isomerase family mycothiol-dependent enzyme [Nocardioides sp.]